MWKHRCPVGPKSESGGNNDNSVPWSMEESEEEPFEEEPFEEEPCEEEPSEEEPFEEEPCEEEPSEEEPSEEEPYEEEPSEEEPFEAEPYEEEPSEEVPFEEEPYEEEPSEEEPFEAEPYEEEPSEEVPFEAEPFEEEPNEEEPFEAEPFEEEPSEEEPFEDEPCQVEPNEENMQLSESSDNNSHRSPGENTCQGKSDDETYKELTKDEPTEEPTEEPNREETFEGELDEEKPSKEQGEKPREVDPSEGYADYRSYSSDNDEDSVQLNTLKVNMSTDIIAELKRSSESRGIDLFEKSENLSSKLVVSETVDTPRISHKRKQTRWDTMPGDPKLTEGCAYEATNKRSTTCSNDESISNLLQAIKLPDFIFNPEFLKLNTQASEITKRLLDKEVVDDRTEDKRSPSPPPVYDNLGIKVNSRESSLREKLVMQRQAIITHLVHKFPGFIPPPDYIKPKLHKKIYMPVKEYPGYNFIGLMIGPQGTTNKRMQKETGARILMRGKGFIRKDQQYNPDPSDNEDLHVLIETDNQVSLDAAAGMVEKILILVEEECTIHKLSRLREPAEHNVIVKKTNSINHPCNFCHASHPTSVCPLASSTLGASTNGHQGSLPSNLRGGMKQLPDFIFDLEFQKLHTKASEISKRLLATEVFDDGPEDVQSPSPPPIYANLGIEVNSREFRLREKLMMQREAIISELVHKFPGFIPPDYKKQMLYKKIYMPVKEYPGYNFISLMIGPQATTSKRMQKETGARILMRGKGFIRKDQQYNPEPSDNEDLHVLIEADNQVSLDAAAGMVEKLLSLAKEECTIHKLAQPGDLAEQNKIVNDINSINHPCNVCYGSHPTSVCPLAPPTLGANSTGHQLSFPANLRSGTTLYTSPLSPGTATLSMANPGCNNMKPQKVIDYSNLYVSYLPQSVNDEKLIELFLPFGQICSARLMRDKITGLSKGYAFVKYTDHVSAAMAIANMNGYSIDGHMLAVRVAGIIPSSANVNMGFLSNNLLPNYQYPAPTAQYNPMSMYQPYPPGDNLSGPMCWQGPPGYMGPQPDASMHGDHFSGHQSVSLDSSFHYAPISSTLYGFSASNVTAQFSSNAMNNGPQTQLYHDSVSVYNPSALQAQSVQTLGGPQMTPPLDPAGVDDHQDAIF